MLSYVEEVVFLYDNFLIFRKGYLIFIVFLGIIRDNIYRVMKRGEITLMVLVDFSKVFDIICFRKIIVIRKCF